MTKKPTKPVGFSLPETMVAMLLVLSILGMVAVLMREYASVSRHTDARDKTFDGIQFALTEMAHEVSSAINLVQPASTAGSNSSTLVFRRIDPSLERFPLIPEDIPDEDEEVPEEFSDETWDPRTPAETMLVTYRRELDGRIVRQVVHASGAATTNQTVADSTTGLTVTKQAGEYLLISLSFQQEMRVCQYQMQARVWSKP